MDHYFLFTLESQSFDTVLVKKQELLKTKLLKKYWYGSLISSEADTST